MEEMRRSLDFDDRSLIRSEIVCIAIATVEPSRVEAQ